jgi:hypothetical protein
MGKGRYALNPTKSPLFDIMKGYFKKKEAKNLP